jgi:hypothetical protein
MTAPTTTAIVADAIGERARLVGQAVAYLTDIGFGIAWTNHARVLKGAGLERRVTATAECGTYRVPSETDPRRFYTVRSGLSCDCPDHTNRAVRCGHMAAVLIHQMVEQELGHRALNRAAAAPYFPATRQPCRSQAA